MGGEAITLKLKPQRYFPKRLKEWEFVEDVIATEGEVRHMRRMIRRG